MGHPMRIKDTDVQPGEWVGDLDGMPPGCPVQPLGMDGDTLYCMDALGQLSGVAPNAFGQKFIQRLFGDRFGYLYWAWPRHDKKGFITNWRPEKVAECLYSAAAKRGLFSPVDRVRGRGAWKGPRGELIYHSGDALWDNAKKDRKGNHKPVETGFHNGVLYARRPEIAAPWPEPITPATNPARDLVKALRRWNWERPDVDPILFLGWLVAALIGGALPWRPTAFVVGDKSVGKSTLQYLVKSVLGDALIQSADTSAAGIYQRIGQDSLAVAVDELEAEADSRKVIAVVKLARLAASGAMMLRGGQDHAGVEFRAQSSFFFSSINPPPLLPQDLSRMAILRLRKLDDAATSGPAPVIDPEITGPMLLRQVMDEWSRFDAAFAAYREALRHGGHDGRGQDTLGVLLACADLALGAEVADELGIPMVDDLKPWSEMLKTSSMLEYEDATSNWKSCLVHLLTSRVEAWRSGSRQTVGQLLDDLEADHGAAEPGLTLSAAQSLLAQAGLRVMIPGEGAPREAGWVLCVPNESQLVASLFRDTQWAGVAGGSVWKSALRQGPPHIVCTDPKINRVRVNGVQTRCTLIRLKAFNEEA